MTGCTIKPKTSGSLVLQSLPYGQLLEVQPCWRHLSAAPQRCSCQARALPRSHTSLRIWMTTSLEVRRCMPLCFSRAVPVASLAAVAALPAVVVAVLVLVSSPGLWP